MSESKDKGWLYDFSVKKTVEKKETKVVKNDKGEETETTRTTKEVVPVSFKLKKPNRRLYEDADLFYGIKLPLTLAWSTLGTGMSNIKCLLKLNCYFS